jgi:hypothetical protein
MNFPRLELDLRHPRERVKAAILGNELEPYFNRSGWLTQGGAARGIRWQAQADGSLLGKVGYFRAKNLSVFRFRIQLAPSEGGTRATLLAHHGPFSAFFRFLAYAIGLCLCVVGVFFSYLVDKAMQRGLLKVVENLQNHLKLWDNTAA